MNPIGAVAFLLVSFQCTVNRQFGVYRFFNALPSDLCQPELELLRLGGGDGLNHAEKLLGDGNIGFVAFSVLGGLQFQLLTICQQLICSLRFKPLFQLTGTIAAARFPSKTHDETATTERICANAKEAHRLCEGRMMCREWY